jgi:predicted Zn-dependent protease
LQRTGDLAGAEKEYSRAIGILSDKGSLLTTEIDLLHGARLGLASSEVALRKFVQARQTTAAILADDPTDMLARMLAAQAAFETGENEEARTHLDYVLAAHPDDPIANLLSGLVSLRQGRNTEGEQHLEKALSAQPANTAVRLMLARVQAVLGKPVDAIATFAPILEQAAGDPRVMQLFESFDLSGADVAPQALGFADELAEQSPASFVPDLIRARVHFQQRDYDSAIRFFSKAGGLGGGRYAVLGGFLANRGLGNTEEAKRLLNDWLETNADDAMVRSVLANSQLDVGEKAEATEQYEQLLAASRGNVTVLNNLAWLYGEIGDARAVGLAREAHRLAPDSGAVTDTLGWLLVQNAALREGIQLLRLAVSQAPQNEEIRQHLAAALSADGQEQEASKVLAELIDAGPVLGPTQTER